MIVTALKSPIVTPGAYAITAWLDQVLPKSLPERTVLAVTSKVIALCENNVVPLGGATKQAIVRKQADYYAELPDNAYDLLFTITRNTLIPNAGVDESNVDGHYVLWPQNPQRTANKIRAYLKQRYALHEVGVVITDSTVRPFRFGMGGVALAFSGFKALHDYRGKPDLFGRNFEYVTIDVPGGLAAAATFVMGEGAECTPAALLSELPFMTFQQHDPTAQELASLTISLQNDLYAPILTQVSWKKGGGQANEPTPPRDALR